MAPIPKQFIKEINSGKFPKRTKKYFVNMTSDSKKLNITNCKKCSNSTSAFRYIDFYTVEEAFDFFKEYDKDISRCEHCSKKIKVI